MWSKNSTLSARGQPWDAGGGWVSAHRYFRLRAMFIIIFIESDDGIASYNYIYDAFMHVLHHCLNSCRVYAHFYS